MAKSFPWMQLMIAMVVELRAAGFSPGVLSALSENALLNDSFTLVRNTVITHVPGFRMSSSWIRRLVPVLMSCARFQLMPQCQNQKAPPDKRRLGPLICLLSKTFPLHAFPDDKFLVIL
jgi:hypothetical protein